MGMKIEQHQKQNTVMTRRLIQNLEVLQMNSLELEEYICSEVVDNPVMDMDEFQMSELRSKEEWLRQNDRSIGKSAVMGEDTDLIREPVEKKHPDSSLREHLRSQLYSLRLDEHSRLITNYLVCCVDSKGFLDEDANETARLLGTTPTEVKRCIELLRTLSPTGICAKNMQECLVMQLNEKGNDPVAETIVNQYMDSLAKGHISSIAKHLGVPASEVRSAAQRIKSLSPIPAAGFETGEETLYIAPDARISAVDGKIDISVCKSYIPFLRVDKYYSELYKSTQDASLKAYLDDRLEAAARLIQSVSQREKTLSDCLAVICEIQRDYILKKRISLLPMSMNDVADRLGVHVSTISRAMKGKYIQCNGSVITAKELFSAKASRQESSPESADMIKKLICQRISKEDRQAPLSDQQLCDLLAQKSIKVSRRTVAKYRAELEIPSTFLRRSR